MQSICALLPDNLAAEIAEARALMAEEPAVGQHYDPPFAHFTLQLAEDYDWVRLKSALTEFTAKEEPFTVRTMGLFTFGNGKSSDVAVLPYSDDRLRAFQERFWKAVEGSAIGRIRGMDAPETFFPHVTIKRCGTDHEASGRAYAGLIARSFSWEFNLDNVSVQHDPAKNSRTHYLRWRFPFGQEPAPEIPPGATNALISEIREVTADNPHFIATVHTDDGKELRQQWSAAEMVLLRANLKCSDVHFTGARCVVEQGKVIDIEPATPFPRVL